MICNLETFRWKVLVAIVMPSITPGSLIQWDVCHVSNTASFHICKLQFVFKVQTSSLNRIVYMKELWIQTKLYREYLKLYGLLLVITTCLGARSSIQQGNLTGYFDIYLSLLFWNKTAYIDFAETIFALLMDLCYKKVKSQGIIIINYYIFSLYFLARLFAHK